MGSFCLSDLLLTRGRRSQATVERLPKDVTYVDFHKAFHKIPYQTLVVKLKSFGVPAELRRLIGGLARRSLFVVMVYYLYCTWGG